MKKQRCSDAAIMILSICFLITLSSCGSKEPLSDTNQEILLDEVVSDIEQEAITNTAAPEMPDDVPPELTLLPEMQELPENQETSEPPEDFVAQYIGKTVGDVVQALGEDYVVDYYEGSTMIGYPGNLWFLFGSTEDTITDDLIIRQMIASGQNPAVYRLAGSMTYPEIVETAGGKADIPEPDLSYSLMDDDWTYKTGFAYCGYYVIYTWLEDPENTRSASVFVTSQDVDSLKPNDQPSPPETPKEPDRDDSEEELELFCGPGWFEGVMGSRFYVPDGFTEQDFDSVAEHSYSFRNPDLDMSISVQEMTFMMLGADPSAMLDEYTSRAGSDSVTYATSGDNFYVVSGSYGSDGDSRIYYNRVDYDDTFRYEVDFQYPAGQAKAGEQILIGFFKNYSTS